MFQETDGGGWMSGGQDIVLAELGADSIAIKLSRYFGIVRFSQYLRTHLPEKENLGLSQKKHLDDLVSPANLLGTFLETYRTSQKATCEDMRLLTRIYEQNLREQIISKVGEINFHLDIGLFGSGHPDYPLIVGKTDANRKIRDKNMSDFGFLAALNDIRKELVTKPKLSNWNSARLRDLAKTLTVPQDNLSIEQLNASKGLRSWTSFSYEDEDEEQT